MFNRLKTRLIERETKLRLTKVLKLIYSNSTYDIDRLIQELRVTDDIEKIEYFLIIETATKLERPYKIDDITKIHEEQIKLLQLYVNSPASKNNVIEVAKAKANLGLLCFNVFMRRIRQANENDKYSSAGIYLRESIAKGRPLSEEEETRVNIKSQDFKRLNDEIKEIENKLNNKQNASR